MAEVLADMAAWKNKSLLSFDAAPAANGAGGAAPANGGSRHVKTHFNDALVGLLREVRQLQALGLGAKREVLAEVEVANKFYRWVHPHARTRMHAPAHPRC